MAKQKPYRYRADAKEINQNTHDFCKRERKTGIDITESGERKASTATGVSKSMVERIMRHYKAPEQNPQLTRRQLFKASLS